MTGTISVEPVVIPKPWGSELLWERVPGHYCGKFLRVNAGCRLSLQYHSRKIETMMLQSGEAILVTGDTLATLTPVEMIPGVAVRICPGVIHRLCAITNAVVLELSTDDLQDVSRVDDDYRRSASRHHDR